MKRITAIFIAFAVFVVRLSAQTITCGEVAANVGNTVTVCAAIKGVAVDSANKSQPMLLFMCAPYPHQSLIVVIRQNVLSKFYSQPKTWINKQVCITGQIGVYKGRNEIEIKSKDQIIGLD